jgi:cephalosporin hydroxylase
MDKISQRDMNRSYFYTEEWKNVYYNGINIFKYPSDIITYREIIFDTKPEVIIETGTCKGTSSLMLYDAMVSAGVENPLVVTVDIREHPGKTPRIPGIISLIGSSLNHSIVQKIERYTKDKSVMVSLDSDHTKEHVLAEINIYNKFVTPGNYLIVEDTFLGEYGVFTSAPEKRFRPDTGGTPKDAVEEFLKGSTNFVIDKTRNKFISMNPNGALKRI